MSELISILIPTLNRSDYLVRALYYYSKVGFKGYICIGDSSDCNHVEKTKHAIQDLEGKLNIIYRYFPNPPYKNDAMCMRELIELAPTPYAVYAGDDDFAIPRGLEKCVMFLEDHLDYSAAHGIRISVRLQKGSKVYGRMISADYCLDSTYEQETAIERWRTYMRFSISTQYYVRRTETWRRIYRDVDSVPLRYLGPELLPCSLSVISGKVKTLDYLSIVFQVNDDRYVGWDTNSMYGLIIHQDWSPSVQVLRNSIVEALRQQDNIDAERGLEVFDKELWHHLMFKLQSQYSNQKNLREVLKNIPWLVVLVNFLRRQFRIFNKAAILYEPNRRISLHILLKSSSPYYVDFIPVYDVIQRKVKN
jgi:glycosyltransferase domain-containing protein